MTLLPTPPARADSLATRQERRPGCLLRLVRDQRVAFVLVGGINTALGVAWFVAIYVAIGVQAGYMVTLLCAHVAAVLCAFMLHRTFVFRVRGHIWLDLFRFELVNLSALSVNVVLLPVTVELLGVAVLPAQLLVTVVTVTLTYFAHRGFSFHRDHRRRQIS